MVSDPITPEEAKALADKIVDQTFVPKKIPAADDIEGQITAVVGALASALLTSTEMPLHTLQPVVRALASQMVAYGIRQTEHVDPEAIYAPTWITDGARQEAVKLPDQPNLLEALPVVEMTATAPKCPKRIAKAARAVRL